LHIVLIFNLIQISCDAYRSKAKPSYGLVVPAGVDISKFDGEVGKAVNVLTPLEIAKTGELESLFVGDLLKHLQTQIAEKGA